MSLTFTKMHGLGNDFMVIDAINQEVNLSPEHIRRLASRHRGVGFDQCLLVEPSRSPDSDFFYRIFNADGNEVGQCGNGARCLARFVQYYGLSNKTTITVATATTRLQLHLNQDNSVSVDMGTPRLQPHDIPLKAPQQQAAYTFTFANYPEVQLHALSVGNPHAVLRVDDLSTAPVGTLGKAISEHALFPEQSNAGFMQILAPNHIKLRVYERGCGETQACGSGAAAAAAAGRLFHQLQGQIRVSLTGGDLLVDWPDTSKALLLTGPAEFVYEGVLLPCAL